MGISIATYSTIDRVGVRIIEPWLFAAILFPVCAAGLAIWVRFVDRTARTAPAPSWKRAAVAGFFAVDTYILILAAYSIAPLSIVSPLRESAIVLVSGWGSFRLAEAVSRREGLTSLAGAALIVIGGIILAVAPAASPAAAPAASPSGGVSRPAHAAAPARQPSQRRPARAAPRGRGHSR